MSLPLPNLDDRSFADLVDEARARIPSLCPTWTDHNPSDPGMTLIELFAWLSEMLIYRTNQVPARHVVTFLKLLNGPDWQPSPDLSAEVLAEEIRTTVVGLRERYRAVTCGDYEALARAASPAVARAKCVARRNLDAPAEANRTLPQAGHLSVILVPNAPDDPAPQPSEEVRQTVWQDLDPRRVLTTRHHVVGPVYAPISAQILIARRSDVPEQDLRGAIVEDLADFLHPLKGGPDKDGWPFGRDIYVSELYELLEGVRGVDYVPDIVLSSQCQAGATRCVSAPQIWHDEGDLIGLHLEAHHLPQAQIDPTAIVVWPAFLQIQVTARVRPAAKVAPAEVRRAVKNAVKGFFRPPPGWPAGAADRDISPGDIRAVVARLPQVLVNVADDVQITLQSDPSRLFRNDQGDVIRVHVTAAELMDAQVTVLLR